MIRPYEKRYDVDPEHSYLDEYRNGTCMYTYRRIIDWDQCPHLQTEDKLIERQGLIKKYGINSAFIQSMLFGKFQRAEDYSLIYTDEDINRMRVAMSGKNNPIGKDVFAASDTSGGGDAQPLMVRIGTDVVYAEKALVGMTGIEHAEHLVARLETLNIPPWDFIIDGGGIGAEVANYMETRLGYSGIKRAQANVGPKFKFEYRDKYTETHFLLKELLTAGVLRLPWNDALLKQMRSRRFVEMESGLKIKTESKKEHRKREHSSPDDLDTLIYLFYDFDWSTLDVIKQSKQEDTDAGGLTQFEKEAMRKSAQGTGFNGLKDMSRFRDIVKMDMNRHSLRVGK